MVMLPFLRNGSWPWMNRFDLGRTDKNEILQKIYAYYELIRHLIGPYPRMVWSMRLKVPHMRWSANTFIWEIILPQQSGPRLAWIWVLMTKFRFLRVISTQQQITPMKLFFHIPRSDAPRCCTRWYVRELLPKKCMGAGVPATYMGN